MTRDNYAHDKQSGIQVGERLIRTWLIRSST